MRHPLHLGYKLPCRCSSSASLAGREFTSSSSHSSLSPQYKDLHMSASSNSPHAAQLPPLLLSFLSLPSFVSCRGTIALLECVCVALARSTSGHWASNSRPYRLLVWAWQYGVGSVQSVSIIDHDCGTCDMSPPAWDLEAQLRISQPPKISCRGATNHLLCSARPESGSSALRLVSLTTRQPALQSQSRRPPEYRLRRKH